jgi:hypothetical protein
MGELVEWLRAQLDEDRAALLRYRDGHEGPCLNYKGQDPAHYDDHDSCVLHLEASEGTPYRDAEFGLREIDATRQVLDEHEQADRYARTTWGQSNADQSRARTLGKVVRLLALPYVDRPGYRDDWRP